MNTKKAISILLRQKSKLLDKNFYKDENWVFQTASYIKDFFGDNSTEYSFISRFTFTIKVLNVTPADEKRRLLAEKEESAIKFLDNCIETLQNKGIYKSDKNNFLRNLDNATIIGLIIFFGSTLFGIGYYFGTEKVNKENIELSGQVKILNDSLKLYRQIDSSRDIDTINVKNKN